MHVNQAMIHPELQQAGKLIRLFLPRFTERTFRMAKGMNRIMKGKCRNKLHYEQKFIDRSGNIEVTSSSDVKNFANGQAGSRLRICVYAPPSAQSDVPGLLWIHGGGYAMGAPEQDETMIRRFIEASGCVVVAPDYRLSLDAPYPAALDDCYEALLWLKTHGREYGMRDDQIMIGGDSAGGGLAAAVCLAARDRREVAIAFQMPLYPMLDDRMNTPSATDNDAPLWNSDSNRISWQLYLGDRFGKPDVPAYAAPARAKDLRRLPPACSFVGSIEPFRDETVLFMEKLLACGIPVHFKMFEGCFHGFDVVCPRSNVAQEAMKFLFDSFRYATKHYFAEQSEEQSDVSDGDTGKNWNSV